MKKGGHNTGAGIERDCDKANQLQMIGYKVFRIPTGWFTSHYDKIKMIVECCR